METKKLIKILLKDMTELEELISEVKHKGTFDPLEMEFIHTRAKGLAQLAGLLDDNKNSGIAEIASKSAEKERFREIEGGSERDDNQEILSDKQGKQMEGKDGMAHEQENKEGKYESGSLASKPAGTGEKKEDENDDEMLMEEPGAGSRLGDSFLKGKSVNDIITDQHKLEFKLSNRPVSSIRAAIGINDRFQYIRELFDNDARKFLNTVEVLDSMNNIKEAVEHLRKNFKWTKTETSLKFVNLVRRRFHSPSE
jgi:hypothetical protein